jgi:hypothetical protein
MAGNEHRDPVARTRPRYRPRRSGAAQLLGYRLIAARRAFRDALERAPHLPLERGGPHVERQLVGLGAPLHVRHHGIDQAISCVGGSLQHGRGELRAQPVDQDGLVVAERHAANSPFGDRHQQQAERGGHGGVVDSHARAAAAVHAGRHAERVAGGLVHAASRGKPGLVGGAAHRASLPQGALERADAPLLLVLLGRQPDDPGEGAL